ncbi:hypothetical protein CHH72_17195 [Shouchella clausii]|uniref:Uncharacterized protein n=2 Tax=Shouchella clausii TaxID=79880 RepID=A0A268NW20_SHOCL|nr:hypothetical protein CHH72_17195 [Shouchella clausii]
MNLKALRKQSRTVTYHQIGAYLAQKKMPEPLIQACVQFLKDQARENGERFVGPKTMQCIIKGTWCLTERELETIYHKAPMPIRQYVDHVTCDPDMPPMKELIRPVERCSVQAQRAHVFLSESAMRVVYGMLYEPDRVWKVVRLCDEEPVTSAI